MPTLLQGDLELVRVCEQRAHVNSGCDDQHLPAHHWTAHDPGQFEDYEINPALQLLYMYRWRDVGGGGFFIEDMSH